MGHDSGVEFAERSTEVGGDVLANAGRIIGVGDFRQEKGRGSFGTFEVVNVPADLLDAPAQWAALETPVAANRETDC